MRLVRREWSYAKKRRNHAEFAAPSPQRITEAAKSGGRLAEYLSVSRRAVMCVGLQLRSQRRRIHIQWKS
jgi:hypothetical protein